MIWSEGWTNVSHHPLNLSISMRCPCPSYGTYWSVFITQKVLSLQLEQSVWCHPHIKHCTALKKKRHEIICSFLRRKQVYKLEIVGTLYNYLFQICSFFSRRICSPRRADGDEKYIWPGCLQLKHFHFPIEVHTGSMTMTSPLNS